MSDVKVKRTTYNVDGFQEPCIIVSNGCAEVRISKCYHLIGENTLYMRETLGMDGEFNAFDEFVGDFDTLTDAEAIRLAKEFSAYL